MAEKLPEYDDEFKRKAIRLAEELGSEEAAKILGLKRAISIFIFEMELSKSKKKD